jgi:N-acetylmuramidase
MSSPATFNRQAVGRLWNLSDLPAEWSGFRILLRGDTDQDLNLEPEELDRVDWIAFSEAVGDFQKGARLKPREQDSKLGPGTLKLLKKAFDVPSAPSALLDFGTIAFRPATAPSCAPPGRPLVGHTPEERVICNLWNSYGGAIKAQAEQLGIPVESALAVFYVESKQAYDLNTGLVIIRYEPHIFKRKSGRVVSAKRGGQAAEWDNFRRAYEVNPQAALDSCSYGLPQLMGFNYFVTKHACARDMVLAFQDSCVEQVGGFFGFVVKNKLVGAVKKQDWRAFARVYNGPGAVDDYSTKLNRATKVINSMKQDGKKF